MKAIDLTGRKFGYVTVIGQSRIHIQPSGRKRVMWKCRCEACGKEFEVRQDALKNIESCGCRRNIDNGIRMTVHSESRTRLYKIYYSMIRRCYDTKLPEYNRYGGRGIYVCDEWRNDKLTFFEWARNNGYNPEDSTLSLERIDVDGNYEPSNCKWIPVKDQYNNMRKTIRMANISLAEFCRRAGLDYKHVRRLYYSTHDIVYALGFSDKPRRE